MILLWLFHYKVGLSISMLFGISMATIAKEIQRILPILWAEY
jgi:hypothetical protein